jgi:hypothetical protein
MLDNLNTQPFKRMKMKNKQASKRIIGFNCWLFAVLAFAAIAFAPARANAQRKVRNKYERPKRMKVDNRVYNVCELMPCFKGGDVALLQYLGKTARYPQSAQKIKKEGCVIVSFIVEKDGSLSDFKVERAVDAALDAEALRVMKAMPNWLPGQQDGRFVRVRYNVPLRFKLN